MSENRERRIGRPPGRQLRRLYDRRHEMRRLIALGLTNQQIAAHLGCSSQTVSNERRSVLARPAIDELHERRDRAVEDIRATIEAATPRAMKLMEEALEGSVDGEPVPLKERLAVAKHMAGIGGFSPVQRVKSDSRHELAVDGATLSFIKELADRRRGGTAPEVVLPRSTERRRATVGCEVAGCEGREPRRAAELRDLPPPSGGGER